MLAIANAALLLWMTSAAALPLPVPDKLSCTARQTAGFHDYPHNPEAYEASVFFESTFELSVNRVFMQHQPEGDSNPVYLTLIDTTKFKDRSGAIELSCARIRDGGDHHGLSCSNTPPAQLLLLNAETLRFTRTSIGGWVFHGARDNTSGDSIYVEYGTCQPR